MKKSRLKTSSSKISLRDSASNSKAASSRSDDYEARYVSAMRLLHQVNQAELSAVKATTERLASR